jgi:predicted TPR repeat methyltransferase
MPAQPLFVSSGDLLADRRYQRALDDLKRADAAAVGGLFVFTVETYDEPGVRLQDTLRYAHGAPHARAAIASAGLQMQHLAFASTRNEKGEPVPGLLAVAGRSASTMSPSADRPGP